MRILIVGLGLIGGSYALKLREQGHVVYGVDKNFETLRYARENNIVDDLSLDMEDFIDNVDILVIGLYPKDIIPFIEKKRHLFKEHLLITDICGIKSEIAYQAVSLSKPATFIPSHPMAGREKVGIQFANKDIFKDANFLITPVEEYEDHKMNMLKQMAYDLGFKNISLITPEHHDAMIAYTSQLTHAIAVSLVNSKEASDIKDFIGDSYRDLTRIAKINGELWSQLFLSNKDFLIDEIVNFENQLDRIKMALLEENSEDLKEIFKESKEKRESLE